MPFIRLAADGRGGDREITSACKSGGGIPLGYLSSLSAGQDGMYHPRHQLSSCNAKRLDESEGQPRYAFTSTLLGQGWRRWEYKCPPKPPGANISCTKSPARPQWQRRKPTSCTGGFLLSLTTGRGTCT